MPIRENCGSENSVIGFTTEGNVVVLVNPLEDTYGNEGATSCVKQKTLLALNVKRGLQDRHQGMIENPLLVTVSRCFVLS